MAFFARHYGMTPDQWKSRDIVIKRRPPPTGVSVALLATTAQLALVPIVFLMARQTGGRQLVAIQISSVAGITLDFDVGTSQRIFRLVVVEVISLPLHLIVARFALGAVSSGVDVLDLVAIHTQRAHAFVTLTNMTSGAGNRLVGTLERKLCRAVVELLDLAPCGFAVAILAFFAKASLMRIDRLVTINAASGRFAEFDVLHMTAGARHRPVRAQKREISQSMIERFAIELDDVSAPSLVIAVTVVAFGFCGVGLASMKSLPGYPVRCNFLVTGKA